jgi:transcriptional regulator with XRE-family HTH domain
VEDVLAQLAAKIRAERKKLGISQEDLAHRCGLHRTEFGLIERGTRNPGATTLVKVARGIGITVSDLLEGIT